MQPPSQNRQNESSASSAQDNLSQLDAPTSASSSVFPASPAATSSFATGAIRPPLRTSTSSPDPLTVPFEQLSLHDQDQLRRRQQQDKQIVQHSTHAPSNPYVGSQWEGEASFADESIMLRRHFGHNAKGKTPDHGHASPPTPRPRLTSRTTTTSVPHRQRPDLPHRNSSFSKRHASFDTPREVPLPYMPNSHIHHLSYSQTQQHDVSPFSHVMADGAEVAAQPSPPLYKTYDFDRSSPAVGAAVPISASDQPAAASASTSSSDSLGISTSFSSSQSPMVLSTPLDSGSSSSTSGNHNPYFTNATLGSSSVPPSAFLQATGGKTAQVSPVPPFSRPFSMPDVSTVAPPLPRIQSPRAIQAPMVPDRSSTVSLPLPQHTPYHTLPSAESSPGSSSSSSRPPLPGHHSSSSSSGTSLQTPTSSDSSPLAVHPSRLGMHHSEPYDYRAASPPLGRLVERAFSATASSAPASAFWERETMRARRDAPTPRASSESLPPPAPPQVLTPPPPPLSEDAEHGCRPYEPFLAHEPPSNDAWISVETVQREYRLLVRLPGFRRDAITLSTRKRRILHVVADSWEPNGGHFERRISFGYDADLGQVRAEFDGEFLRVIVPRRPVNANFWSL